MEPKWNVKKSRPHTVFKLSCINGTKVECKDDGDYQKNRIERVLMEPKWNVKIYKANSRYEGDRY